MTDLWDVADDVDELADSWDPAAQPEPPAEAFTDEVEWVRRRLAALRFIHRDISSTSAEYEDEINRLREALADVVGAPSSGDAPATGLWARVESIEHQLKQYHATVIARAEAEGAKAPSTVKSIHGKLRSGDPGKWTVKLADTSDAATPIAWLLDHGFDQAVTIVPEVRKLNGSTAPGLVSTDPDSGEVGIFNAKGESCPGLRFERVPRWFKVDTPEVKGR